MGNLVWTENEREGTTDWLLTRLEPIDGPTIDELCRRRPAIEAYCSHTSIWAGWTLEVFVSTNPASRFTAEIFRMGYYGGAGGRRVASLGPFESSPQPSPEDGPRRVIECAWSSTFSVVIPEDWLSGVYLGKLTAEGSGYETYFIFVVRDVRPADLLFQCSDLTWQAYNRWPAWRSLYDFEGNRWHTDVGNEVGFDRPYGLYYNGLPSDFNPLSQGSGEFLLWEHPLCFWLEKEGYDVTYISNLDVHYDPEELLRGKAFLSVGHDEYWSGEMFENVSRARDRGVHLAFLSGNAVSGRVRLKESSDGRIDRIFGRWEDAPGSCFDNEHELMGSTSYGVGAADWTCREPEHWVFAGTGMRHGDAIPQLVGWEYHGAPLKEDPSLVVLAGGEVTQYGRPSERTYAATIYEGGSLVFNAATCWWNMLLARPPGAVNPPDTDFSQPDERVQRITRNLLDRFVASVSVEEAEAALMEAFGDLSLLGETGIAGNLSHSTTDNEFLARFYAGRRFWEVDPRMLESYESLAFSLSAEAYPFGVAARAYAALKATHGKAASALLLDVGCVTPTEPIPEFFQEFLGTLSEKQRGSLALVFEALSERARRARDPQSRGDFKLASQRILEWRPTTPGSRG